MTMLNTGGHGVRRLPAFQMQGRPSDYAIKPIDWGGAIDRFQEGQDRARLRRLQDMEEEGANVRLRELQRAEEAALAEEERMAKLGSHWEGLAGEHEQNQMRSGFDFDAVDPETGQVGVPIGGWDDPQAPSLTGDPRQDQVTKELVEMAKLDPTIFQDTKRLKGFLDQKMESWHKEDQLGGEFQVRNLPNVGRVVLGPDGKPIPKSAIFEEGSSVPLGFRVVQARDEEGNPTDTKVLVDEQGRYKSQVGESAKDQQINRIAGSIMADGVTDSEEGAQRIASNIADGRYSLSRNPITNEVQVIDLATGKPINPSDATAESYSEMSRHPSLSEGKTLWDLADGVTGITPALLTQAQGILGQIGVNVAPEELIEARQAFDTEKNQLIRALSINPRYPVSEQQRIASEINISPGAFTDERTLRSRMKSVSASLTRRIEELSRDINDNTLPADVRRDAAANRRDIQDFISIMGVPAEGSPKTGLPSVDGAGLQPPDEASNDILENWNYFTEEEQQELIDMYRGGQ